MSSTIPQVYVGTYGKYNNSSIKGAWLDLENYCSAEEFAEACAELHSDEADPEYMYQDHEGIPASMISESSLHADVWEWLELDEDQRDIAAAWAENGCDWREAQEHHVATCGYQMDVDKMLVENWYESNEVPDHVAPYIDEEYLARDQRHYFAIIEHDGQYYVFNA